MQLVESRLKDFFFTFFCCKKYKKNEVNVIDFMMKLSFLEVFKC